MDGIEEKLILEQHEMCGNRQMYIQMQPQQIAERLSKMQATKKEADLKYVRQDFSNAILAYNDLLSQLQQLGSVPDVELMQLRTASSALQCLMKLENYEEALQMSIFALSCPSLILAPHLASKLYLMKSKVLLHFKEYEAAIICLDRSIALEFEMQRKEMKKGEWEGNNKCTVSDKNKEYRDELTELICSEREGFVAIPPIPKPLPDDELVAICKSILQLSAPSILNVNVTSAEPLIDAVDEIKTSLEALLANRGFLDRKVYLNQSNNDIIAITADTLVDDATKAAKQWTEVNMVQLVCSAAVNINRYCFERKSRERQMRIPAEGTQSNGEGVKDPLNPDIVAPLLQLLLDKGSLATQRIADDKYSTPLHLTCWANAVECTAILIHYGALAIVTDVNGYNPLLVACSTQIVMETEDFAKGTQMYGNKDEKKSKEKTEAEEKEGEDTGIEGEEKEKEEEKEGEDTGIEGEENEKEKEKEKEKIGSMTTLQANRAIIRLLIKNGASGFINHITNEGMSATAFIAQRDDVETLTLLIQSGASINKRNFNGNSIMSCAVIGQLISTQMYSDILSDPVLAIDDGRCISLLLAYAAGMDKFTQEKQQSSYYMEEMLQDRRCAFFGSSISSFYIRMGNLVRSNMQSDGYGVSISNTTSSEKDDSGDDVQHQIRQCCTQLLSFAFPRLDGLQFNMPTSLHEYCTITNSLQENGHGNGTADDLRTTASDNPLLTFYKSILDIYPDILSHPWQLHKPLTIGSASHPSQEIVYIPGSRPHRGQLNTVSKMSPAFYPKQWIHILKREEDGIHSNYFDLGKYLGKMDVNTEKGSIAQVFASLFVQDLEMPSKYRAKTVFVEPNDPRINNLSTFNARNDDNSNKEKNAVLLNDEGYITRPEVYDCFIKTLWVPVSHTFGHVIPSAEALQCLLDANVATMSLLEKRAQRKKKGASSLPVHKGAPLVVEYWEAVLKRMSLVNGNPCENSALVLYAAEDIEEIMFEELWLPSLLAVLESATHSHLVVIEEALSNETTSTKDFIPAILKSSGWEMTRIGSFQLPTFAYAKLMTMSVMRLER